MQTLSNEDFVEIDGNILLIKNDWFCSKFRVENKFFFFVQVGEITEDGYRCKDTGVIYPFSDVMYKAAIKYTTDIEKIIKQDDVYIHIHTAFNLPKNITGWGFSFEGLNERALSSSKNYFFMGWGEQSDHRHGSIILPPFDSYMSAQISAIKYYYSSVKNIQITL